MHPDVSWVTAEDHLVTLQKDAADRADCWHLAVKFVFAMSQVIQKNRGRPQLLCY